MKKILSEQTINILKLPNDKRWEYALINNFWHTRKQGSSGKWISIDNADPNVNPKVKNPQAVRTLNNAFPQQAKLKSDVQKTTGTETTVAKAQPTTTVPKSKKLPTDFNKNVTFFFNDKTTVTLSPKFNNISKKLIDTLGLGDMGNSFMLPKNILKKVCSNNVTIFTPEVISAKKIYNDDIENWCIRDSNWKTSTGAIIVPKETYGTAPTFQTGTYAPVQENNLKSLIKKILKEETTKGMSLNQNIDVSKDLQHHLENNITLSENVFRIYSKKYFELINEVRNLYEKNLITLNEDDKWLVESDLGKKVKLSNGDEVYLDAPIYMNEVDEILTEAKHRGKNVKLNSPFRTPGGPKKFAVYVKTPKGTIKKVTFGDPKLKVRNRNPKAAKSFTARHKCSQKKDRTTAGYWSCHVGRYAKKLGLKSSRTW